MSMIFAGVDVGSTYAKTVVMGSDGKILSYNIIPSGTAFQQAAEDSLYDALRAAKVQRSQVTRIVATGYGRTRVDFADTQVTEITCHARGAHWCFPDTCTIIDIGGQDSKAISLSKEGQVINFVMNDKCAAGTGRFLEVMADSLQVSIEEMSGMTRCSESEIEVSSICTVFAQTEVVSLLAGGCATEDIAAGLYRAIARRLTGLVGQVGLREKVQMTGGVAKNAGVVRALEEKLGTTMLIAKEPQIAGACGAALIAIEQASAL